MKIFEQIRAKDSRNFDAAQGLTAVCVQSRLCAGAGGKLGLIYNRQQKIQYPCKTAPRLP